MNLIHAIPGPVLAVAVILLSCALAVGPYALARRIMLSRTDEQTKDLAGSVIFRISALHSLILALVFAQELVNFNDARSTMTREAALVGDVFYDLKRYDEELTKATQADLLEYTNIVLNKEGESLASGARLDEQAWEEWKSAYLAILDLEPRNARQAALKEIMVDRVREISDLRIKRENTALAGVHELFLFAAVTGIVIISFAYFPFPPTGVNLTLLLIFGLYTGLVIYFIVAFANPFSGAGQIEPVRLERLYEGMVKSL